MTRPTEQPGSRPAADGARWRGHTHKELYLLLHDGPGAAASAEPSRRWAEISAALGEIGQDLHKALEQSGASWTGKAAGAAYDRLSVTAAWATDTGTEAAGMRAAVESQADHIARARADMPAPEDVPTTQPDPTLAPAVQVAKAQADLESAEAAASSAEERAFEVMAAYELNTNTTTGALASFESPPDLAHRDEVHHGQAVGTQHTHASVAGLLHHGGRPAGHGGGHGGWHWPGTNSSSAPWSEPRGGGRGPFEPGRGGFSGVLDPLLPGSFDRSGRRSAGRPLAGGGMSGSGGFSGGGSGGSGGTGSGPGGSGAPWRAAARWPAAVRRAPCRRPGRRASAACRPATCRRPRPATRRPCTRRARPRSRPRRAWARAAGRTGWRCAGSAWTRSVRTSGSATPRSRPSARALGGGETSAKRSR